MPITYHLDQTLKLLVVHASGHVTVEDRAEFVAAASVDSGLPAELPILIDVSRLSNVPSASDVLTMARLVELLALRFRSRIAYFVTGVGFLTPYSLASAHVQQQMAEARTFTDCHEAIQWLKG